MEDSKLRETNNVEKIEKKCSLIRMDTFLSESVFSIINFQSLEIVGDLYQYSEAFCHSSWNSPEEKKQVR